MAGHQPDASDFLLDRTYIFEIESIQALRRQRDIQVRKPVLSHDGSSWLITVLSVTPPTSALHLAGGHSSV